MLERSIDKQLRILKWICNSDDPSLTNDTVKMSQEDFQNIFRYLAANRWLKIEQYTPVPVFIDGEETDIESNEICVNYTVLDHEKIKYRLEEISKKCPPKRDKPTIRLKALEIIARKFSELNGGIGLADFLKNNGVDNELVIYPNIKWKMVYDVFEYLALSGKKEDNDLIFTLLEEISHPLMFGGDRKRALEIQDFFSGCLQYDGYCIDKGKVVEVADKIIEEVDKRNQERETIKALAFSQLANDPALSNFFSENLFHGRFQEKEKVVRTANGTSATEKYTTPIHVNIYNNNTQTTGSPEQKVEKSIMEKITLRDAVVSFNDDTGQLNIGDRSVIVPPFKNEHYFCRSMFKRKKKEPVDWSIIFQEMTGKAEPDDQDKNKRMVQDTMYGVNNRIKEILNVDDELFVWSEKTATRMY